jgi:predicted nucleic acid-binding protein
VVLDANVVGAWSFLEADTAKARQVLSLVVGGQVAASVPELFWAEFQQICGKKLHEEGLPGSSVERAYRDAEALPLRVVPVLVSLREDAWRLRRRLAIGSYDAYYLALAVELDGELWTLDREFRDRASADASIAGRVKLIGADVLT